MDDELHQLEGELERLRPARPSGAVAARVAQELAWPPARQAGVHWLWRGVLPAAAAIALLALILGKPFSRQVREAQVAGAGLTNTATAPLGDATLKPVAAENVLYAASDEGLVTLDDGTTARQERLSYVDTITWKNPLTRASLTWSVPREEVRVVPVNFQ